MYTVLRTEWADCTRNRRGCNLEHTQNRTDGCIVDCSLLQRQSTGMWLGIVAVNN